MVWAFPKTRKTEDFGSALDPPVSQIFFRRTAAQFSVLSLTFLLCAQEHDIRAAIWSAASAQRPLAFASSRSLGKNRGPGPVEGSTSCTYPLSFQHCVAQSLPEPCVASLFLKALDGSSFSKFVWLLIDPLALSKCLLMIQAVCPMCQDNFLILSLSKMSRSFLNSKLNLQYICGPSQLNFCLQL